MYYFLRIDKEEEEIKGKKYEEETGEEMSGTKDRFELVCSPDICTDDFIGHKTLNIHIWQEVEDLATTKLMEKEGRRFFPDSAYIRLLGTRQYKKKMVKYATCDLDIVSDDSLPKWELAATYGLLRCEPNFAACMGGESHPAGFTNSHHYSHRGLAMQNEMGFIFVNFFEGEKLIKELLLRLILTIKKEKRDRDGC